MDDVEDRGKDPGSGSAKLRRCKDCAAEEVATKRAVPHPGPRCATHHRRVVAERREREHERKVCANFGLKPGDYKRLYEAQGGKCAVCQVATGKARKLAVDHDHRCCPGKTSCGKCVRGLICSNCNRDIGRRRDDPEAFFRAGLYLINPPARAVLTDSHALP